jgi:hypothetical protein
MKLPLQEQIADIGRRRAAARIPDEQRYRPKRLIALELLDELAAGGLHPPVLSGDAGYGQITEFRRGLTERDIRYVLAITSTITVHPAAVAPITKPRNGRGPRPKPAYPGPAVSVKDLAAACGAQAAQRVSWRPINVADLRPAPACSGTAAGAMLMSRRAASRAIWTSGSKGRRWRTPRPSPRVKACPSGPSPGTTRCRPGRAPSGALTSGWRNWQVPFRGRHAR